MFDAELMEVSTAVCTYVLYVCVCVLHVYPGTVGQCAAVLSEREAAVV